MEPWEIFDVMVGTSTGGILAVLLGLLKVPVDECIAIYENLGKEVFEPGLFAKASTLFSHGQRYPVENLERVVKEILNQHAGKADIKLEELGQKDGFRPYVVLVANRDGFDAPYRFANFRSDDDCINLTNRVAVWEAIRATSAAPTYFEPIVINIPGGRPVKFYDGGVKYNNPIQVARNLMRRHPFKGTSPSLFVSLGTGMKNFRLGDVDGVARTLRTMVDAATSCEVAHEDAYNQLKHEGISYFRFNPGDGLGDLPMDSTAFVDRMWNGTQQYLIGQDTRDKMMNLVKAVKNEVSREERLSMPEAPLGKNPTAVAAEKSDDVYKDQIEQFTASLQPQDKSRFSNAFVKKTFSLYSPGAASEGPSHHCVGMAGGQLLETRLGPCGSGRQDAQKRVFIGYAGEDFNFVELLKNKLEPYVGSVWVDWENVVPFEDNLASQPAYVDRIKGELQDAALIIFVVSKKWVGKNFPMLELEWALNLPGCGTRVLPVLLDWNLTEAKESNLAIAGSANLLHRLFNLTTLNTDNDHSWSDLIDLVANTVVERPGILPKTSPANWVGREADVKAITAALGISESGEPRGRDQEGCIVALGGMSGVGKSALLKHLYDLARPNYVDAGRKVVFVAVGHDANDTKIMAVQKQILAGLGVSFKEGESLELKLQVALRRDSYTLFVDDVWHGGDKRQLESLFGGEWKERLSSAGLGKGSIVVIAGQALPETLQSYYKHKLGRLSHDSAMKLFCRNAFGRDEAPNGCTLPWKDVVDACAGLPLALTVFGSVLQGKDDSRWNEALADLRHVSDPEVGDRLKVAYKLLESEQRHAFVDIAMHWHGQAWEVVNAALGHGLLTELLRRSLVDKVRGVEIVGWDRVDVNVVGMHDLLKNVGKAKANERNSWLVDPTPERVKKSKPRGVKLTKDAEKFQKGLLELRILIIEEGFSGKINLRGCEELRWLAWLRCPDTSMELNRCEKLVWLDLRNGALRSIGLPKTPTNLRYLDIKGCRSLPELSALTNLEWLSLESSTILSLPDNLRYLDIKGCRSLPELSALTNLEWLSLESSTILSLPDLSALTKLKLLDLSSCTSLTSLPDLSALTRLETLNLRGCTSLPKLSALSALTILERLDLRGCTSLTSLPELLALTSLETLDLSDGTSLTGLPQLSALTKLETLDLQHCTNLTSLPDLSSLTKLERLYLEECTSLTSLPELFALTKLRELLLRDCTSLTSLPELSALTNLAMLDLRGCTSLTSLPELLALTSLETLDLRGCTSLTSLPGLSALTNLESLDLRGCTSLTSLPDLPALNLKSMNMMGCTSLTSLPGLSVLTNLTDLDLSGCTSLTSLPDLSTLSNLEWLDLSGCTSLTSLPELLALTSLETLDLSGGTSPRVSRVIKQKPAGGRKPTEVNEVISDSDDDEKPAKKGSTLKRSAESTSTDAEPAKKKKSTSEE